MKIIQDSSVLVNTSYHVCTVGYFDGVHLGHQKIIEKLVTDASTNKGKSILVSFWPHPRKVLYPNDHFDYIQSNEDKFKSIENPLKFCKLKYGIFNFLYWIYSFCSNASWITDTIFKTFLVF